MESFFRTSRDLNNEMMPNFNTTSSQSRLEIKPSSEAENEIEPATIGNENVDVVITLEKLFSK